MAVVQELVARMRFQIDRTQVDKVDRGLASMAKSAALLAGAYYAASKAASLVVESVKSAANLEAMNAEFEVLLKNAEAAKYLVQQIQQYAIPSPFATQDLANNVRIMMAFGQSANDSFDAVKRIGDIAGSNGERLNRLSLAYAQTMAAGKLQGQDLLQFVNAGFNPLQELSKKTGKSVAQLRKDMEDGAISAQMVKEAFVSATSAGGLFYGNTAKQAQTLNGLWSNMADGFRLMMQELGGDLVPFVKDVVRGMIEVTDAIGDTFRQLGEFFRLFFEGGPDATDIASGIAAAFQTVADVIMTVGTALQGIWTILEGLATFLGMVVGLVADVVMGIPKAIAYALKGASYLTEMAGKVTGNKELQTMAINERARAESFIGGGLLSNTFNQAELGIGRTIASGKKTADLFSMIGGSKGSTTPQVKLNDSILKALQGNTKQVTNNFNTNTTIHAEGTMKDILTEQANSILGLGLQARLIAATV